MARLGPLLSEAQWKNILPLLPNPRKNRRGAARGSRTAVCWKGFSGFCGAGPVGSTYRRNIRILRPAGGGCGIGRSRDLAESLACISERIERTPAVNVERIVLGRELCSREKRGWGVGKTKRGKGAKWVVVVDGRGVPLGEYLHSASPAEVRLAETTLATIRVGRRHHPRQKPVRVIADKAYDSDPLQKRLRQRGIELICPQKRNRV
jgi:hypothetical protein